MIKYISLFTFIYFLAVACVSESPKPGVSVLDCKAFKELFNDAKEAQLIDVRTPEEFAEGNLNTNKKTARNLFLRASLGAHN